MLIAVLERKAGLSMTGCDIFVNVAGGLRIEEPALDLPISMALVSSLRDFVLPDTIVTFGEIGLSGEVRSVPRTIQRLTECSRMGFARAIIPKGTTNSYANEMVATEVTSLVDALAHLRLS
jgi:DNA repair protein RadA/Sms